MPDQPMERSRAAVVLFVDSETAMDGDLGSLVKTALWQNGIRQDGLTAKFANGTGHHIRIVDVMDLGQAAGNGYLWTEATSKAWKQNEHSLNERGLK